MTILFNYTHIFTVYYTFTYIYIYKQQNIEVVSQTGDVLCM